MNGRYFAGNTGFVFRQVTDLRTDQRYRVRFYLAVPDIPMDPFSCKLSVTFGDQNIDEVIMASPTTFDGVFEEFLSSIYRPTSNSAELKFFYSCSTTAKVGFSLDDISVEFA